MSREHRLKYCPSAELAKKEIDVISVPSKCVLLVHEPKLKVDLIIINGSYYYHLLRTSYMPGTEPNTFQALI